MELISHTKATPLTVATENLDIFTSKDEILNLIQRADNFSETRRLIGNLEDLQKIRLPFYLLVELNETTFETSFNELKKYMVSAASSLKRIQEENRQNHKEIFDCREAGWTEAMNKIKRFRQKGKSIFELANSHCGSWISTVKITNLFYFKGTYK